MLEKKSKREFVFRQILRESMINFLRQMFRVFEFNYDIKKFVEVINLLKNLNKLSDSEYKLKSSKYNLLEQNYIGCLDLLSSCPNEGAEFFVNNYAPVDDSEVKKYAKLVAPFAKQIVGLIVEKLEQEADTMLKAKPNKENKKDVLKNNIVKVRDFTEKVVNNKALPKGGVLNVYSKNCSASNIYSKDNKEKLITNNQKSRFANEKNLKLN